MNVPWKSQPFRPGAVAFELPNESGVVYLFDEGERAKLRKSALGKLGSDVFHESPRTLATLAKKRQFVVLDVEKDATIVGFLAVGPAPTSEELAGVVWNPPRRAELTLPSGRLRLETAGSFSLGPDPCDEDGLFVDVPPGDYQITLHERSADAELPTGAGYCDVPRVLLTLSPQAATPAPDGFALAVRPAPPPEPPGAKYRRFTLADGVFEGLASPDGTLINCTRRAAKQLGLDFGAPLRAAVGGQTVDAYYLDNISLQVLKKLMEQPPAAGLGWFSGWTQYEELGKESVLSLWDWRDLRHVWPIAKKQQWREARIERSTAPRLLIGPEDPGSPTIDKGALRCRVVTWTPTTMTLNVDDADLATLGIPRHESHDRIPMRLTTSDETRRLTLTGQAFGRGVRRFNFYCAMGDNQLSYYHAFKRQYKIEGDLDALAAAIGPERVRMANLQPLFDAIRRDGPEQALTPKPFPRPLDLVGQTYPHWHRPDRKILWIETIAYPRDSLGFSMHENRPAAHELRLAPGDEVLLSPAPLNEPPLGY